MSKKVNITAPVALERDICAASLVRSRIEGTDIVIWRDASGNINVWEDNCPHRSVRLSIGRNLGDCLEEIYHGWRFGKDATVIAVPAEGGRAYANIKARVLASAISGGFVWATLGKTAKPDAGFAGTPTRPIHVKAGSDRVESSLEGCRDLNLWITPWDEDASVIYGVIRKSGIDALRTVDARLSVLRRQIEEDSA